jgi:hypothetical protein
MIAFGEGQYSLKDAFHSSFLRKPSKLDNNALRTYGQWELSKSGPPFDTLFKRWNRPGRSRRERTTRHERPVKGFFRATQLSSFYLGGL